LIAGLDRAEIQNDIMTKQEHINKLSQSYLSKDYPRMASFFSEELPDYLLPYKNSFSPNFFKIRKQLTSFIKDVILPAGNTYVEQRAELRRQTVAKGLHALKTPQPPILDELRAEARKRGLWNFFIERGGLTNLEYAPIAEMLGAFPLSNIAMNCSAPDTGNMEVLEKYGTPEQKDKWLTPLLNAEIRSCFIMTEPGVASSDATNISTRIDEHPNGKDYIINGHKWWISGSIRPECKVGILLGKTTFEGPRHSQQSMIIVPMDTPGINILHPMQVFGEDGDHAEIIFDNVIVPKENMILGPGRGFEIAQGRLAPGRIHHCMRTIGTAERALSAMIYRAKHRVAFDERLDRKDTIRGAIAEARIDISKCRQLCYLAACMCDEKGFKAARQYISMIKVAAPRMALAIVDEAMQVHGGHGVSQYSKLSGMYRQLRTIRLADGPDIVHLNTVAKMELAKGAQHDEWGKSISGINKNIEKYGKFRHVDHLTAAGIARGVKKPQSAM